MGKYQITPLVAGEAALSGVARRVSLLGCGYTRDVGGCTVFTIYVIQIKMIIIIDY